MVSWANTPRRPFTNPSFALGNPSRAQIPLHYIQQPIMSWVPGYQRGLFTETYPDLLPYYPVPQPNPNWSVEWMVGPMPGYWWI